jgi:choline kinase
MARITIGIPTNRHVRPLTVKSLLELVAKNKEHTFHIVVESEGLTIEDNRNNIATQALANKSEYLLFVDDDMVFDADLLKTLLDANKMVIGVAAKTRSGGSTVKMDGIQAKLTPKRLFTCRAVGTGVMLIDTEIFGEFKKPWFKITRLSNGEPKEGEDVYFCDQVRGLGHEIWCDPTVKIKHIGDRLN